MFSLEAEHARGPTAWSSRRIIYIPKSRHVSFAISCESLFSERLKKLYNVRIVDPKVSAPQTRKPTIGHENFLPAYQPHDSFYESRFKIILQSPQPKSICLSHQSPFLVYCNILGLNILALRLQCDLYSSVSSSRSIIQYSHIMFLVDIFWALYFQIIVISVPFRRETRTHNPIPFSRVLLELLLFE